MFLQKNSSYFHLIGYYMLLRLKLPTGQNSSVSRSLPDQSSLLAHHPLADEPLTSFNCSILITWHPSAPISHLSLLSSVLAVVSFGTPDFEFQDPPKYHPKSFAWVLLKVILKDGKPNGFYLAGVPKSVAWSAFTRRSPPLYKTEGYGGF